ncbi:DUF4097 family beta strand repeat-containing protein [Pseudonocardia humida]|uniref:DUF4097 family beta strand repeat protein n=1 Tax=Pseudonocardia humida TaxID=2800819 RepID=A0ABT0ZZ00_9PSEU|nr:DUF4097 family beta strand repeat-containing protein [Pseudonocardia humida]MCO1655908.1 DUF4097 family beta strand repeat protein [Pseudonocardia humida]
MTAPAPTRPRRALVLLAVVFVLLAVVPGAVSLIAQGYRSTTEQTTSLASDVAMLTVRNGVGDVELVASPDDLVHVRTYAEHGLEPPALTAESTAAGVLLSARCEDLLAIECRVDYEIEVPRDFAVRVEVGSGDVAAHGLSGALALTARSGDTFLSDLSGPLTVRGDSGDVNAVQIDSDAVVVERTDGNIFLDMDTAPSDVRLWSERGDVVVGVPGAERYRVDSWAIDGETRIGVRTDASSAHAITATSGGGDVLVRTSYPFPGPLVLPDPRGDGPAPVPPRPPDPPVPPEPVLVNGG